MSVEFDHVIEVGDARDGRRPVDRLSRQSIARLLADRLLAYSGVVGLYGSWGSGKSFVLDLTIDELFRPRPGDRHRPIICYFQPWQVEPDTSLAPGLIRALRKVPEQFEGHNPRFEPGHAATMRVRADRLVRLVRRAVGILGPVAHVASAALGQVPAGALPALDVARPVAAVLDVTLGAIPSEAPAEQVADWDPDVIKKNMQELIDDLRNAAARGDDDGAAAEDFRVVVVIDDLDRCAPDLLVDMLNWLKVHLSVPGCSYLLALDHEAASKAIVGKYRAYLGESTDLAYGLRYLEKIVDFEIELGESRLVEQMAAHAVSGSDSVIGIVESLIKRQGVRVAETRKLMALRTLQSPRTMLKIVERFGAALSVIQDDQGHRDHAHLDVRQLPADFSFWLLLLTAMYYRLSPWEIEAFCHGQGPLVSLGWTPPGRAEGSLDPLAEFRWFIDTALRGESGQPTSAVLLRLYTVVRQLVPPVTDILPLAPIPRQLGSRPAGDGRPAPTR